MQLYLVYKRRRFFLDLSLYWEWRHWNILSVCACLAGEGHHSYLLEILSEHGATTIQLANEENSMGEDNVG